MEKEHPLTSNVRRGLQVWMIEPTVVVQKIIIGECGMTKFVLPSLTDGLQTPVD